VVRIVKMLDNLSSVDKVECRGLEGKMAVVDICHDGVHPSLAGQRYIDARDVSPIDFPVSHCLFDLGGKSAIPAADIQDAASPRSVLAGQASDLREPVAIPDTRIPLPMPFVEVPWFQRRTP
jgi:hypothetical protein